MEMWDRLCRPTSKFSELVSYIKYSDYTNGGVFIMEIKICKACNRELPRNTDYFFKNIQTIDGYRPTCKECMGNEFTNKLKIKEGYRVCSKCNKEKPATREYFDYAGYGRLRGDCKECTTKVGSKYYLENKESITEYNKIYYALNKEEINKTSQRYHILNKERLNEYNRNYYKNNKEYFSKYSKKYYSNHKIQIAQVSKQWRENNKLRIKESRKIYGANNRIKGIQAGQRRQARKRNLESTLTAKQWENIKFDFHHKCAYCGEVESLQQEHFLALSKGGEYTHNNIIPVCRSCNSSKCNKDFFDWYPKHKSYDKNREKFILEYLNYTTEDSQQLALFR